MAWVLTNQKGSVSEMTIVATVTGIELSLEADMKISRFLCFFSNGLYKDMWIVTRRK